MWFLTIQCGVLLFGLIPLVGVVLLERTPSNIVLYVLGAYLMLPSCSAAIYAFQVLSKDDSVGPWRTFLNGLRLNFKKVLGVFLGPAILVTILGMNIAYGRVLGTPDVLIWFSVGFLVLTALMSINILVINALFDFRIRDLVRLGLAYLTLSPVMTFGSIGLTVVAAWITYLTFDAVVVLFAVIFLYFIWLNSRNMVKDITERFVAQS